MQLKLRIQIIIIEIIAALFVLLFLYTAISKLRDFTRFVRAMLHTPAIANYSFEIAVIVPLAELFAVVLLIIPRYRAKGIVISTLLMAVFTAYVGYILSAHSDLPCTCGGILETMNWREHLFFNIGFLILGLIATFLTHKRFIMINRRSRTPVI